MTAYKLAPRMAVYFVLGSTLVAWALILTALGLTRGDFPAVPSAGRALMALSAAFAVGVLVALVLTTEREHPREEAKAEAAEKRAEEGGPKEGAPAAPGKEQQAEQPAGGPIQVREYKIQLAQTTLKPGKARFDVSNVGKIQHDLAVKGPGGQKKTPLIDAGKKASLEVALKPGNYELLCTVPGHAQLGMKTQLSVK
jgi:plastocyanin